MHLVWSSDLQISSRRITSLQGRIHNDFWRDFYLIELPYLLYADRQAWVNSVDPHQNAASD